MEEFEQRLLIQQEMVCFLCLVAKFNLIGDTNQKEFFHTVLLECLLTKLESTSLTEFYVNFFIFAVQNNSRL